MARATDRLEHTAWQIAASYFLTGEENSFKAVTPLKPFTLGGEGWGAWEVAARYDYLDLSSPALDAFPAVPGVANSGAAAITTSGFEHDVTVSVACFLNPNTRFQVNWVHAFRNVAGTRGDGHVDALGMRIWWDF